MRFSFFSIVLFLIVCAGCVSVPPSSQSAFYWPPPPELPRLALEAQIRDQQDLLEVSGIDRFARFFSGEVERPGVFIKPYDIAARGGVLAVTDSRASVIHVIDIPRKRIFPIGWRREGKLSRPAGVAIDNLRRVYVADSGRGEVIVYDRLGLYIRHFGDPAQFSRVSDVAVSPLNGDVYVLDRGGVDSMWHRITRFDSNGEFIAHIGQRGHGPAEFNHPTQLDITADGRLVILDAGNFRVQILDADGGFVRQWGRAGTGLGNLARPRGLAVSDAGLVMVSDTAFQNFQIFDLEGRLYLAVGNRRPPGEPGRYVLPSGIAIDETGRVYVVDQVQRRVDVWRLLSENEARAVIR